MLIETKLDILAAAPALLEDLLNQIPVEMHKQRRIPGKWSIHEHAVHLEEAQKMIIERFKRFQQEENPVFEPYLPGTTVSDDYLIDLDLATSLADFRKNRQEMIDLLRTFTTEQWTNEGTHPEYRHISALLWIRHVMMHDHFHMYRIEELWLTTDSYLRKA